MSPPRRKETSRVVVVVGAGLAGLVVARRLRAAGIAPLLIEPRERLGGRILTDEGCDLGPSWFWPRVQPAIAGLVAELGLASFPQNTEGDALFERTSHAPAQREPHAANASPAMRLVGGTAALVRALAHDLPSNGLPVDDLRLGTRVAALTLNPDGVELTLIRPDGGSETLVTAHVVAALPPRLLAETVTFSPPPEPEIAALWRGTPTWMAPHAKFFACFARPFWREAGLSGAARSLVGPMVEIHDATTFPDEGSGVAALFGFLGVPAERRAALAEDELTHRCLAQFARLFGDEALTPTGTILKDWAADPLTATPLDRTFDPPVPTDAPWVTGPWRGRLSLAGSETSPTEPGYLDGAVTAAERAVSEVLDRLAEID